MNWLPDLWLPLSKGRFFKGYVIQSVISVIAQNRSRRISLPAHVGLPKAISKYTTARRGSLLIPLGSMFAIKASGPI